MKTILLLVATGTLVFSGCVWKSDFNAKLAEIDGLKTDVAGLEERQKSTEKALAGEKQKIADLEAKIAGLEREKAVLQRENANVLSTLASKRDQLVNEVVRLKNLVSENEARIAELSATIDKLNREKQQLLEEKERAVANVKSTYDSLVNELRQEIKEGEVQITQLKDKLTVNMVEKILFDSGSAEIKKNGKKVLDRVADILMTLRDQQIKVEGHTDNVPISARLAERFPTNWELSTARATTVVRYLQERGVAPAYLGAEGYAEFRPVAPNDSDENRARNRRIEIVLLPVRSDQ
jgi:chemotaxis protein MotB